MIRERFDNAVTSVGDRLGRIYRRNRTLASISTMNWIEFLFIGAVVIILAGLVNAWVQPVSSQSIIYPGPSFQSSSETLVDILAIWLGSSGIYVSYLAGRQTTKPRMVNFYLVIGLLLLSAGLYIGIYVNGAK